MQVCFTGTMETTRINETKKFNGMGIHVKNTVTKNTDILVTGYNPGRTKLEKAHKYNINVLSEESFFVWLRENNPEYFL